ncbi:MAG: metalloregulator ArsR/SmtB family transcription factor [Blastocatellia bacterium]
MLVATKKSIDLQAKLFRGFAEPARLAILQMLRKEKSVTVGDIVEATSLSQSNVSNHLNCLKDCGLVTSKQQGRFVYYRLSDERIAKLLDLADEILADVAKGVYECTRLQNN